MKKVSILAVAVLFFFTAFGVFAAGQQEGEDMKVLAGVSLRWLNNPYFVSLGEGAKLLAEEVPNLEVQIMECQGNDEKQINDVKNLIARGGKNTILFFDPNQAPNAAEIVEICEEAGVYCSSVWSMAEGVYPVDYKYYVNHQTPNDQKSGYDIAVEMFERFDTPGKGKILAIQGMLGNSAAINRFKGLQRALEEYPDVELVDDQAGDWDPMKALNIAETWLNKYSDIDAIWCANDNMALSVIEALKKKGLNGEIQTCGVDGINEAVAAIKAGNMTATVGVNPHAQGFYGLALPYAAITGRIDPEELPAEKRMFYTKGILITPETVEEFEKEYVENTPTFDYEGDLWANAMGPINVE